MSIQVYAQRKETVNRFGATHYKHISKYINIQPGCQRKSVWFGYYALHMQPAVYGKGSTKVGWDCTYSVGSPQSSAAGISVSGLWLQQNIHSIFTISTIYLLLIICKLSCICLKSFILIHVHTYTNTGQTIAAAPRMEVSIPVWCSIQSGLVRGQGKAVQEWKWVALWQNKVCSKCGF